jgi:Tol biopolymer transport system component
LLALVLAPWASEASSRGRIVFEASRTVHPAGVFTADANGGDRRWVFKGRFVNAVVVAPDGAFAFNTQPGDALYESESGATRRVGTGVPISFSPDGSSVLVRSSSRWEVRDRLSGDVRLSIPQSDPQIGWVGSSGVLFASPAATGNGHDLHVSAHNGSGDHIVAPGVLGTEDAASPDGTWIADQATRAGDVRIVRPDGSNDRSLASCEAFVWSPDGSQIACETTDGNQLAFVGLDGAVRRTNASYGAGGAWSPDSTRFAFTYPSGADESTAVAAESTGDVQLVADGVVDPQWSPDGRTLLVQPSNQTISEVVAATGGSLRPVPLNGLARWLPGGRLIVWVEELDARQLAAIAPAGGPVRYIPGTEGDTDPVWSPDRRHLAFDADSEGTIGVCDADGRHRRLIVHGGTSPAWSPDGRSIAYVGASGVYVVPALGGHPRLVTRTTSSTVSWSPDGKQLAFDWYFSDGSVIAVVGADGKHRRIAVPWLSDQHLEGDITWSPNGSELAFAKQVPNGKGDAPLKLFVALVRDGRQIGLSYPGSNPSWSPDGTQIVASISDAQVEVVSVAKRGHAHVLTRGANPSWSRR